MKNGSKNGINEIWCRKQVIIYELFGAKPKRAKKRTKRLTGAKVY